MNLISLESKSIEAIKSCYVDCAKKIKHFYELLDLFNSIIKNLKEDPHLDPLEGSYKSYRKLKDSDFSSFGMPKIEEIEAIITNVTHFDKAKVVLFANSHSDQSEKFMKELFSLLSKKEDIYLAEGIASMQPLSIFKTHFPGKEGYGWDDMEVSRCSIHFYQKLNESGELLSEIYDLEKAIANETRIDSRVGLMRKYMEKVDLFESNIEVLKSNKYFYENGTITLRNASLISTVRTCSVGKRRFCCRRAFPGKIFVSLGRVHCTQQLIEQIGKECVIIVIKDFIPEEERDKHRLQFALSSCKLRSPFSSP